MKILIVDDEAIIREWIQYSIHSFEIPELISDTASDGLDALKKLQASSYDVVFIDIQMPRMNGLELLNRIKEISPQTITIILSSHDDFEYAREAMRNNSYEYILKSECSKELLYSILTKCKKILAPNSISHKIHEYLHITLQDKQTSITPEYFNLFANEYNTEPYFCISILNGCDDLNSCFHTSVQEAILSSYVFLGSENSAMFFLCSVNSEIDLADFVDNLIDAFPDIRFAVSKYWYSKNKISEAILNSWFLLDHLYYTEHSYIIGYKIEAAGHENILNNLHSEILDNIKFYNNRLLMQNFTKLNNWISENRPSTETVKNIYSNILYTLCVCAPDISLNFFYNIKNIKKEIYNCNNFAELTDYMMLTIKNFIFPLNYSSKFSIHVTKVLDVISEHYMNLNSIGDIASYVHLNSDYLTRLFKKETGKNLSTFLLEYKLSISANLLRNTSLQVSDIATQVGIYNISYFSKKFKEYYDTQPINYRNKYKNKN